MKQEALKYFTDIHLTVLGLMIFFGYFIFISIQALKMNKNKINYLGNMPLESENTYE